MATSADLAAELRRVLERLDELPHPMLQTAREACHRVALEAHRNSLEVQLSTALVHEERRAVDERRRAGENSATTTRAPSEPMVAVSTAAAV